MDKKEFLRSVATLKWALQGEQLAERAVVGDAALALMGLSQPVTPQALIEVVEHLMEDIPPGSQVTEDHCRRALGRLRNLPQP